MEKDENLDNFFDLLELDEIKGSNTANNNNNPASSENSARIQSNTLDVSKTNENNISIIANSIPIVGEYGYSVLELKKDIIKLIQRDTLISNLSKNEFLIKNWEISGNISFIIPDLYEFLHIISLYVSELTPIGDGDAFKNVPKSKDSKLNFGYLLIPGYSFFNVENLTNFHGLLPLISNESFNEIVKSDLKLKSKNFKYTFDSQKLYEFLKDKDRNPEISNLLFLIGKDIFQWEIPVALKIEVEDYVQKIEDSYAKDRREYILKSMEITKRLGESLGKLNQDKIKYWNEKFTFEYYETNYYKYIRPIIDEWLCKKEEYYHLLERTADYYTISILLENHSQNQLWNKDLNIESIELIFPSESPILNSKGIRLEILTENFKLETLTEIYDPVKNKVVWKNFQLLSKNLENRENISDLLQKKLSIAPKIELSIQIEKESVLNLNSIILELHGTYDKEDTTQIFDEAFYITPMGFPICNIKNRFGVVEKDEKTSKRQNICNARKNKRTSLGIAEPTETESVYGFYYRYIINLEKIKPGIWNFSKQEFDLTGLHCFDIYDQIKDIMIKQGGKIEWELHPLEIIHPKTIGITQHYGEILVMFDVVPSGKLFLDIEINGEGEKAGITGSYNPERQRSAIIIRIRSKGQINEQIQKIINIFRERFGNNGKLNLKLSA